MTFLDAINAGLPIEKALTEAKPNFVNDLTEAVLEKLLKKKLSLEQIADGFAVHESFVIMKLQEFGLNVNGVTYKSSRRKMTILEGLKSGMSLEHALEVCDKPLSTEITPENVKWLYDKGFEPNDVSKILNLRVKEAANLKNEFIPKKSPVIEEIKTDNEFLQLSSEEKVARVLPMVQQGKTSSEIHEELSLRHPAALQFIRKAKKQLAGEPTEQGTPPSVMEEELVPAADVAVDQAIKNIEFQWESDLFPNSAPAPDEIRLLSDGVSFSLQLLPSVSAYEIGISKDLRHLAIRAVLNDRKGKTGTVVVKGQRKRISAKRIVKKFLEKNLQPPLTFKIIEQSKERIVGELVS